MTNRFYGDTSKIYMAFQCREDEADRLRAVFEGKSVCVIANGESVLNKNYGPLVDLHDIVVRMNAFRIAGFERHVGTKTDIHAFTSYRAMCSEECRQAKLFYCSDGFFDNQYYKPFYGTNGDKLLFWSRPRGLWELYLEQAWPTTGLRIFLDAYHAGAKNITLLGHDCFGGTYYYYNTGPGSQPPSNETYNPPIGNHNPPMERAYVEFLAAKDRRIIKL